MEQLDKIEQKIDKISDKVEIINVTLAGQHETLKEHIRRTEILEDQIRPIQKHVTIVSTGLRLIGLLIAGGLLSTLITYLSRH